MIKSTRYLNELNISINNKKDEKLGLEFSLSFSNVLGMILNNIWFKSLDLELFCSGKCVAIS